MAERLKVVRRGFTYPADADSLALIRQHGGRSKLPADAVIRLKRVEVGDFCDDMPAESAAIYLERGDIVRVPVVEMSPAPRRRLKEAGDE